jgi:hypothetical protein
MADTSSSAAQAANKPHSHFSTAQSPELPRLFKGFVRHFLMSPTIQVRILSIIDEAGSATVGDVIEALPGHPDPVGALQVMIDLGILIAEVRGGVLDANTLLRRSPDDPSSPEVDDDGDPSNPPDLPLQHRSGGGGGDGAHGVTRLDFSSLVPRVLVSSNRNSLRALKRQLCQPGIYGLGSARQFYVGRSDDAGRRVCFGQQPISDVEQVVVITDQNGGLTSADAAVCERILWSRAVSQGDREVVNDRPDGAPVSVVRYAQLEHFVGQVCLMLQAEGILFGGMSPRAVLAGPRAEAGRLGPLRPFNERPEGEIFELEFGGGLLAIAARQADDRWLLLSGSEVRVDTVASATASASFLRAAWLHAGLLEPSPDGSCLIAKRDLVFESGSAVSHFCAGAKGRGLAGWKPIDPDGGFDANTPALIAA